MNSLCPSALPMYSVQFSGYLSENTAGSIYPVASLKPSPLDLYYFDAQYSYFPSYPPLMRR